MGKLVVVVLAATTVTGAKTGSAVTTGSTGTCSNLSSGEGDADGSCRPHEEGLGCWWLLVLVVMKTGASSDGREGYVDCRP